MKRLEQMIPSGAVLDGTYKMISCAGRGAQGAIYKASQVDSGQTVAVKLLHSDFCDDFNADSLRLEYEYNALMSLRGLPMFLAPYRFKKGRKYTYLAMEWIDEAPNGADFISQNRPVAVETWLWLAGRINAALHECHKRGILHRDIKPSNILVGADHVVKLIDFGIARQNRYIHVNGDDLNIGTLFYTPPEQITDGHYGVPGEMYALGVTLYEFIGGCLPFHADTPGEIMKKKSEADFVPPSRINPDLPEWVDHVFTRLLAPAPADRTQGTRELFALLAARKAPDDETVVTLNPCSGCGRHLWKELPFCTHCGKLYNLDLAAGGHGVIAHQVQEPERLFERLNRLTDNNLPDWRKHLFKTHYPHVLLRGISREGAVILAETLSEGYDVLRPSATPYRDMFREMKVGTVQVLLGAVAAWSLVSWIFWHKKTVVFSGTGHFFLFLTTVSFLIAYTLLPLAPAGLLDRATQKRRWPALSRFRQKIASLKTGPSRQKASALIRRCVMIYDRIGEIHVSDAVRDELVQHLARLTEAGLGRLEKMDNASELLRKYRKQGIDKKIAACDAALQTATDQRIQQQLIEKTGELAAARSNHLKIEQQHADDEIVFSHILAELNSIYIMLRQGRSDRIKGRLSKADMQWGRHDPRDLEPINIDFSSYRNP